MLEYNNIIELISPCTIRQIRRNYNPYLNKKLIKKKQYLHRLHIRAKHTKDNTDWTEYKNLKATLNKEIHTNKTNYINKRLDDSNDRWSTLQDINNTKGVTTPRNIIHNNKIFNYIQDICNIANDHYIDQGAAVRPFLDQINTRRSVMTP